MTGVYFQPCAEPMPRVIAALTMLDGRLVRTVRFKNPSYVGDPINAVKIFNDKGTDELVLLEIGGKPFDASRLPALREIAAEAFMPISYGGGVRDIEHVRAVIRSGFEKVVLNTAMHDNPTLADEAGREFGAQAVVGSIEVGSGMLRGVHVRTECGRRATRHRPVDWARRCEELGCGELLVTFVDRDGTMSGYDLDLVREISDAVSVPVIPLGGAGTIEHLQQGIAAGASAVAAGSMFVYWGPRRAVLINYPNISAIHD
ncbi:MAG: HisA/HisF-related TIM barrel protein [Phycisphaerales bacterium]